MKMKVALLLLVAAVAAHALPGALEEKEHAAEGALCDSVKQYSGYFKLETGRKNYFYWFFESRTAPADAPVVLWLTGGSSTLPHEHTPTPLYHLALILPSKSMAHSCHVHRMRF